MRVIVTRPAAQAGPWVDALRTQGVDARALPLIGIEPLIDDAPVRATWRGLDAMALVMFVSANAVQHFFSARPRGLAWPDSTIAGSTGPGTSAALRAAGVPETALVEPAASAGRLDSEALWAQLASRDWRGAPGAHRALAKTVATGWPMPCAGPVLPWTSWPRIAAVPHNSTPKALPCWQPHNWRRRTTHGSSAAARRSVTCALWRRGPAGRAAVPWPRTRASHRRRATPALTTRGPCRRHPRPWQWP